MTATFFRLLARRDERAPASAVENREFDLP